MTDKRDRLIIFDMDNTILQSAIDFPQMRTVVWAMLDELGLPQYKCHSTAESIMQYTQSQHCRPEAAARMWREVGLIEDQGMLQAVLEPGAIQALAYLHDYAQLAVLTNNTDFNLSAQLDRLGVSPYLSCVAGRDRVGLLLKPQPGGMQWIMAQYPHIDPSRVLTVGDAWNDAEAARRAHIGFVAYNRSRQEDWQARGVSPLLRLTQWDEPSCEKLLALIS